MNPSALIALATLFGTAPEPVIQRPAAKTAAPEAAAPETAAPETAAPETAAPETAAPEDVAEPGEGAEPAAPAEPEAVSAEDPAPQPEAVSAEEPEPEPEVAAEPEPAPIPENSERFKVASGAGGPPYYGPEDQAALQARHGLETSPSDHDDGPRWRCLIADPACGRTFEVNALAAYTYRGRQASVAGVGEDPRWSSGRAQYDFWMNLPIMTEVAGTKKYTRMTLGPKGGLTFSDGGSTWGNLGMAFRYWMGRGRWAPTIEFTSALTFKVGERSTKREFEEKPKWEMTRGPVGFTADIGFGLGGFGAIVVGGQYDSPLAREEIPEQFRTSAGGAFFLGFRGNILWGAPAAAAVATHTITQRSVETP